MIIENEKIKEIKTLNSQDIKDLCISLGADLCGISSVERFFDTPKGFNPKDIMDDCESVIVVAIKFPRSYLEVKSQAPYTFARNKLVQKTDDLTFEVARQLEEIGLKAIAIPSAEPYEFWDEEQRQGRGIISLKHAAQYAGLGKIGKNTLFINNLYGNMVWLGAILVNQKLDQDALADYEVCSDSCTLCLKSCPANALDGITIIQKKCRENTFKFSDGGGVVINCNTCRKVCPNCFGIKN